MLLFLDVGINPEATWIQENGWANSYNSVHDKFAEKFIQRCDG